MIQMSQAAMINSVAASLGSRQSLMTSTASHHKVGVNETHRIQANQEDLLITVSSTLALHVILNPNFSPTPASSTTRAFDLNPDLPPGLT